jgi:pyoverdine/dityrosine biosynthesis protein Dit1
MIDIEKIPELKILPISHDWLVTNLMRSVKLNENAHAVTKISETLHEPNPVPFEFNPMQLEIKRRLPIKNGTLVEKVFSILCNGNFRKGPLSAVLDFKEQLTAPIEHAITHNQPVTMVLPSLPFKNQNPLSCKKPLAAVDLAEWLCMTQLRDICCSVEAIYPPGLKIIIICDGLVYADIFQVKNLRDILRYKKNCETIRDALGLQNYVTLIDMDDLVMQHPNFNEVTTEIKVQLLKSLNQHPAITERIKALERAMLFNLPWENILWSELCKCAELPQEKWPEHIKNQALFAAIAYASFLLSAQYLSIIRQRFPHAIRATVHPKHAPQLPIHLMNNHTRIFPYNGLPVVSKRKLERTNNLKTSTTMIRRYELFTKTGVEAATTGDGTTLCYLI